MGQNLKNTKIPLGSIMAAHRERTAIHKRRPFFLKEAQLFIAPAGMIAAGVYIIPP